MNKIGLIGFGRFGRLIYQQLKNHGTITVYEPVPPQRNNPEPAIFRSLPEVCNNEFLILSVPVSALSRVVTDISPLLKTGTLVMDVCAVKQYPLEVMKKNLKSGIEVVGTHPLFGPDSVRESLQGHVMIVTPGQISSGRLTAFKNFWKELGISVIEMSPQEHDRLMAWTLALTHFLGRALKTLPLPETKVSTRDYQNLIQLMEKINRDTWKLFEDMHRYNPFTTEMRNQLLQAMKDLNTRLEKSKTTR
jgi:prephenate dehydrogenase